MTNVIFTTTFKVSAVKGWQDSGVAINRWPDSPEKGIVHIITVKAVEGSYWSCHIGNLGTMDMNGYIRGTNNQCYATTDRTLNYPYSQEDGRAGQLLFAIGTNDKARILGTGTLKLDSTARKAQGDKLHLNPACYSENETIWLRINDADNWLIDNTGEVDVVFEVTAVETAAWKNNKATEAGLVEKSKKIEELSQSLKDKETQLAELTKAKEKCELTLRNKDVQLEQEKASKEKPAQAKQVIFSQTFTVSSKKGWQDSEFNIKKWFDSFDGNTVNIVTVKAKENATWNFCSKEGAKALVNMDGFICGSNHFLDVTDKTDSPYSQNGAKAGQLLFKVGNNGRANILGTNVLTLDRSVRNQDLNNGLSLDPTSYDAVDTVLFRINDADQWLGDNNGEVEITFEVTSVPVSRKVIYTTKTNILATSGWQDFKILLNGWNDKESGKFCIATLKAKEGASWSFKATSATEGLVNMDGFYVGTNQGYACKSSLTTEAERAGQLLFKLGTNGQAHVLGTSAIVLDKAKETEGLYFNPNNLPQDAVFSFRINDADQWLSDNSGSVEIIFEVVEFTICK